MSSLAQSTGKILRCHALVWHNQLAPWVENTTWTPETLRAAITRHITNVAGHWKGKCYAWDVVNEALEEDGSYRKSLFYKVLGEEYIKLAFKTAAQADPQAKLYYNDYGIERPNAKSESARKLIKTLKDEGIKVDGLGMQAHVHADTHPTTEQLLAVIKPYAELGVEVAFTELDVRLALPANETSLGWQKAAYQSVSGGGIVLTPNPSSCS